MTQHSFKSQFIDRLQAAITEGTLVRLNLGSPTGRDRSLRNLFIRPVRLRGQLHLSFVYRHATRDVTKNHLPADGVTLISELLGDEFADAFLSATTGTAHLNLRKGRQPKLELGPAEDTAAPDLDHDHQKTRTVRTQGNPWLQDLGVTGPDEKVRPGMEAKYRQIHRFIEIVSPLLRDARLPNDRPVSVVDMGCGKGYLTFALHEHLKRALPHHARVQGIEQRVELADAANRVASNHQLDSLQFLTGTIGSTILQPTDVVVALHACDTATDDALAKGIEANARLIVVAPCCHREVAGQLVAPPVLADALRHGILFQREADFVTDALRACLLESAGYEARVFEFISPEHTAKNLMISAVRRDVPQPVRVAAREKATALAAFYGIRQQRLARLLGVNLEP